MIQAARYILRSSNKYTVETARRQNEGVRRDTSDQKLHSISGRGIVGYQNNLITPETILTGPRSSSDAFARLGWDERRDASGLCRTKKIWEIEAQSKPEALSTQQELNSAE